MVLVCTALMLWRVNDEWGTGGEAVKPAVLSAGMESGAPELAPGWPSLAHPGPIFMRETAMKNSHKTTFRCTCSQC